MITDNKRREFAKNLRDQAKSWRDIMPCIRMSDRRLRDIINMAFGLKDKDMSVHNALDMFADLIDRPTCEMTECSIDMRGRIHHKIEWRYAVPKIIREKYRK